MKSRQPAGPHRPRPSQRARRLAAAALCLAVPWAANADCVGSADPQIRALQALSATDSTQAVSRVEARLADLEKTPNPDQHLLAQLYAVLAQSDSRLELDGRARSAAQAGLALTPDPTDPVHVDLLAAYAENVYDADGIRGALRLVEAARALQPPASLNATCLQITTGTLEFRLDRSDLAIVALTQAYRSPNAPPGSEPRMLAADSLSAVMGAMGDYREALDLNAEVIAWDEAHRATLSLSVSTYVRGTILNLMHDYRGAILAFKQSRALSVPLHDVQGIAFEDLRICETLVAIGDYARAARECRAALPVFVAAQSTDVVKETRAVLARIDLGLGRPARALATLDGVLDHHGEDLPPRRVATLYRWRAQANAALHDDRAAYDDLSEYVRREAADTDAERIREAAAMRARFATDQEIERNHGLQRELSLSIERTRRQAEELRRNAIAIVSGILVIAMLVYIAFANGRHRRALQRLATTDELTGLPNRRRTAALAAEAVRAALAESRTLTIAIIDLDHFKLINDHCGHAAGDHVLREVGRAGTAALRRGDVLGRWGGEEFLLVMPDTTLDAALGVLERLRERLLAIVLPASGEGLRVSASAGLATLDAKTTTLDELIASADEALYDAKTQGRDLVRIAERSYLAASTGVRRALRL
jgi:diguanylate cyclase (GGDEF)-like protein